MIPLSELKILQKIVLDNFYHLESMKKHTSFNIGGPADCLVTPENFEQLRQFQEDLELVDNLKTVWTGGSDEGTIIAVSLQKPMTLIRILNYIATVGKVDKKGEQIVVMLRTPNDS